LGLIIRTVVVTDNDHPLSFYASFNHGIKHHINKLWTLHCKCKKSCTKLKGFLFFHYFNFIFTSESFCHLFNEHNNSYLNLLHSSCKPLDMLLIQQTNSKTLKFHPLSNNRCSFSSLHRERKQKYIPPPTILMVTKKNKPKPSLIVIMAIRKKRTHPDHLLYLWNTKKMGSYWIPFIVNVINDCHNHSRVVKGRQQEKINDCESACGHLALWNFRLCFEPSCLPPLTIYNLCHVHIILVTNYIIPFFLFTLVFYASMNG